MKRVEKLLALVLGLWAGAANAAPGTEFSESDLRFDFEINGGVLPIGVANPLIVDYRYNGALPIPTKDGDVFAGWQVGESDVVVSNLDAKMFYKYEDYAYEVAYSDIWKWRLNALWTPENTDDPNPEQDPEYALVAKGTTDAFPLDLREGDRLSAGTEELTFSNLWDGDTEATVIIAQDGAVVFTGLTGEGTKAWSVDRNGRYVLTHTTYTNGVAGKVETAVFVVEGKDEPICPEGEEPGTGEVPEGGISKYDATYLYDGEGHTINTQALYAVTLTGSTPSFSFSLDGETGWQNDPLVYTNVGEYVMWYKITAPGYIDFKHQAKLVILEAPKIENAVARQRYPWNGLVDVDFDLSCELETAQIPLTLIVHDTVGGTNLPCRTLFVDGVAAEKIQVQSGHHRVTWDADADLPDGFECNRVTVEVKSE